MTGTFDQIKLLFEQQLYTNVVSLVSHFSFLEINV